MLKLGLRLLLACLIALRQDVWSTSATSKRTFLVVLAATATASCPCSKGIEKDKDKHSHGQVQHFHLPFLKAVFAVAAVVAQAHASCQYTDGNSWTMLIFGAVAFPTESHALKLLKRNLMQSLKMWQSSQALEVESHGRKFGNHCKLSLCSPGPAKTSYQIHAFADQLRCEYVRTLNVGVHCSLCDNV